MTQDDKARQVGSLMLEIRKTEADLQQHKELFQRYRDRLMDAATPWRDLRVVYEDGTNPTLMDSGGDPISLPTTGEMTSVVKKIGSPQTGVGGLRSMGANSPNSGA